MKCSYGLEALGISNQVVQDILASYIAPGQCCFANQISMLLQNPEPTATGLLVFPPCLLRYFDIKYKQVIQPNKYCHLKSNGNMTIYELQLNLTTTYIPTPIDVYNNNSLLFFQGAFLKVLNGIIGK